VAKGGLSGNELTPAETGLAATRVGTRCLSVRRALGRLRRRHHTGSGSGGVLIRFVPNAAVGWTADCGGVGLGSSDAAANVAAIASANDGVAAGTGTASSDVL
jgi:hypothetical protein